MRNLVMWYNWKLLLVAFDAMKIYDVKIFIARFLCFEFIYTHKVLFV